MNLFMTLDELIRATQSAMELSSKEDTNRLALFRYAKTTWNLKSIHVLDIKCQTKHVKNM